MPDAVLIFTFSPVQSFIAEARRASDLYVGSHILVCLAKAAAAVMQRQGTLIYPVTLGDDLADDVPNKLVARVAWEEAETIAENAKKALLSEWTRIADTAKNDLMRKNPLPDAVWHDIWARQVTHLWEIYWAAASMDGRSYRDTYDEANRAVDAAKHARMFEAAEEYGVKDTLSGCREALHATKASAREYWAEIGEQVGAAKLRPGGRERLDAIGAVKRFCEIAEQSHFPSTSTVASADFLRRAHGQLTNYRETIDLLLDSHLYRVQEDPDWPYDGDLLFMETLAAQRLQNGYGASALNDDWLQEARKTLSRLYATVKQRPSPYYSIIALDGDGMGERVSKCAEEMDHQDLSRTLSEFAGRVRPIIDSHHGNLIYNSGDDVLALAPLSMAFALAQSLARTFAQVTNGSASAGVAIAHHLYPLGTVLQAARGAENQAKQVKGKNAVCARVLKRSGETVEMRSSWEAVGETFADMLRLFQGDAQGEPLSSKCAYDVLRAAYALPDADEKCRAELKRLLTRHRNGKHPQAPQPDEWADRLRAWAANLPGKFEELGHWLVFARFVAQAGSE